MDSIVLNLVVLTVSLNVLLIESKLSKLPPALQIVRVESSVKLECFTEDKGYSPAWTHLPIGSSNPADVFILDPGPNYEPFGRITQAYHDRGFRVNVNRETGEYSLEIPSVKLEDAGQYTCQAKGGLAQAQSGSTQLTVIESPPECRTNVTGDALGSNSCGKEPDMIALSCTFGIRGNNLPQVMWVKNGNPDSVVKDGPAQWTDDPGRASSEFVVKACRETLTESSFTCIVQTSDSVENEASLSCDIPKINVLENANATVDKTVSSPEEVQCDLSLFKNSDGSRWERREGSSAIVVSSSQQLNLFRPEMIPGLYVCIVDCSIHGDMCPFEALRINYIEPSQETGPSSTSGVTQTTLIVVAVVLVAIAGTVSALMWHRKYRKSLPKPEDRRVDKSEETKTLTGQENRPNGIVHTEQNGVESVDIPDANKQFVPGSRQARLRALENKAKQRIQANAAQRTHDNPSFSTPDESGDVAEGIPRNPEKKNE